ncbi:MAG: T9SS type A sorting domain-containing protein, partial [Bacteroidales bacterium]|nr:T9SS type A sorting domain-containing protein [Bacteroidales bacterium]
ETLFPMQTTIATTTQMGGAGTSHIDLTVQVLSGTEVQTIATPNSETAEYHYGIIEKSFFDEVGVDSVVKIVWDDHYPLYEADEWIWMDIDADTYYYAVALGQNANGEFGDTTVVEFNTIVTEIPQTNSAEFEVYPNPASDFVSIKCESENIKIFNNLGQIVYSVSANSNETIVDLAAFENGIYYIKVDGKSAQKLVVNR